MSAWKKDSFMIEGVSFCVVGYIKYPWGIDQRTSRDWHITHLPTGMKISRARLRTLRDAQAMVTALERLPIRWDEAKSKLGDIPKEVKYAAKAIAEGR